MATVGSLRRALDTVSDTDFVIGEVEYLDFNDLGPVADDLERFFPLKYKRREFAHEREIRAIARDPAQRLPPWRHIGHVHVPLTDMIEQIVVSPFAREGFVRSVEVLVGKFMPDLQGKVVHSETYLEPPGRSVLHRQLSFIHAQFPNETMPSAYLVFDSLDEFSVWHSALCDAVMIPHVGYDGVTKAFNLRAGPTLNFVDPHPHPDPRDGRILCRFPIWLNPLGLTVIADAEAKEEGWFDDLPPIL